MSKEILVVWRCEWCHAGGTTYSPDRLPEGWARVALLGFVNFASTANEMRYSSIPITNRTYIVELCPKCERVYWGCLDEMLAIGSKFWWDRVRLIATGGAPRNTGHLVSTEEPKNTEILKPYLKMQTTHESGRKLELGD